MNYWFATAFAIGAALLSTLELVKPDILIFVMMTVSTQLAFTLWRGIPSEGGLPRYAQPGKTMPPQESYYIIMCFSASAGWIGAFEWVGS